MENKTSNNHKTANGIKSDVSGSSIQMNSFRQELVELYMQGWLDRDWKIGEDYADEKAEKLADALMAKYKL